jgi:hypothetical protein
MEIFGGAVEEAVYADAARFLAALGMTVVALSVTGW